MPRFFIDIGDQKLVILDAVGDDLPDWIVARDMAMAVLPDLARDAFPETGERSVFTVVRDAENRVIFKATLILTVLKATNDWTG